MLDDIGAKQVSHDFIKDPIYGYVRLYEHELEIIDTESFQRLRRIKQLPSAHFIYPGATHTRFSHSLGVMHLSGLFASQLLEPYKSEIPDRTLLHYFFLIRLWGLTHDIGHGPFSHAFDEAVLQEMGLNHEYMSAKIVQKDGDISEVIDAKLREFEITPKTLAEYLGKSREELSQAKRIGNTDHNERAFYQILKGFYSTDIIDYLLRDNLYTGAGYGNFDWQRLVLSSHLHKNEIALEKKSRDTLDAFLLSRLFSFNTIYYHRWSRIIDHITKIFLTKAKEKIDFSVYTNNVDEYKKLDEESIFNLEETIAIPERAMLQKRVIPFRQVDQINYPGPTMPFLNEDNISTLLSEKLKNKIPPEAYFVDTPYLPLNPMLGEDEVCILDTSTSPPKSSHEPVRKTSWGEELPYSVWTIRLFLNNKYQKIRPKVKDAFRAVVKGESKQRTHY